MCVCVCVPAAWVRWGPSRGWQRRCVPAGVERHLLSAGVAAALRHTRTPAQTRPHPNTPARTAHCTLHTHTHRRCVHLCLMFDYRPSVTRADLSALDCKPMKIMCCWETGSCQDRIIFSTSNTLCHSVIVEIHFLGFVLNMYSFY